MRLYLSSHGIGNIPSRLHALLGNQKRIAMIFNAYDTKTIDERVERRARYSKLLTDTGLVVEEIDLRDYIHQPDVLSKKLVTFDGVMVTGGNVFVLRRIMHDSGFDVVIKNLLAEDRLVYAGWSAGICVLSPDLRGLDFVDDLGAVRATYDLAPILSGLDLIPYSIAPHYRSAHDESSAIDTVVEFFQREKIPFKTLADGQVIVIDGEREEIVE